MNIEQIMATMQMNVRRIAALVAGVGATQARWKPDAASWSILEVVNHLLDEEREDFRVRIDFTLHRPGAAWPPIDPGGWVTARRYNERDLAESLTALLAEREQSLAWLRGLPTPDWSVTAVAPWGEPFPAGKLGASRSRRGSCWRRGWRTICCTCANWSSCTGRGRRRNWRRLRVSMQGNGDAAPERQQRTVFPGRWNPGFVAGQWQRRLERLLLSNGG